jgi:hypothetical protein
MKEFTLRMTYKRVIMQHAVSKCITAVTYFKLPTPDEQSMILHESYPPHRREPMLNLMKTFRPGSHSSPHAHSLQPQQEPCSLLAAPWSIQGPPVVGSINIFQHLTRPFSCSLPPMGGLASSSSSSRSSQWLWLPGWYNCSTGAQAS